MSDVHSKRIERIMTNPVTEDDHAAKNEILALKAIIKKLLQDKPKRKKDKKANDG
jgi:hypothetical protein